MPNVRLGSALRDHYTQLYAACEVDERHFNHVDALVRRLLGSRPRYEQLADDIGVPWYVIAAIHSMEAGQRFDRHLHNGDNLTDRTCNIPTGRPHRGSPPFSWDESALDALRMHRLHRIKDWTLPRILYELEKYNGWGYRLYHAHVNSPYLWGLSRHYSSGKYVADGTWSDIAISRQCGAAVIIRRLEEMCEINPLVGDTAHGSHTHSSAQHAARRPLSLPPFHYANHAIEHGKDLQRFLNTFDGISLRVDGWPGNRTSDAVEQLFGFRLSGDLRKSSSGG